jgi:hypothetical protein
LRRRLTMHRRGPKRWALVAVALALLTVLGTSISTARVVVASPVVNASKGYLNETAVSPFNFTIREYYNVPLSENISVAFLNGDLTGASHTFTILNWSNRSVPTSFSTGQIGSLIHRFGTLINLSEPNEGSYADGYFTSPPAVGYYEFVCMESGHFSYGMYGYIAFGEILPSNLSFASNAQGPGLAVFIIVGTIVTLTVMAIVLGFVFGQRRGSQHEMPPERLGYPEPPTTEPLPATPPRSPPAH